MPRKKLAPKKFEIEGFDDCPGDSPPHPVQIVANSNNPLPFSCDTCSKSFATERGLNKHMKARACGTVPTYFTCDVCGQVISQKYGKKRHKKYCSGFNDFETDGQSLLTAAQYTDPQNTLHPLKCRFCHKIFTVKSYLQEHEKAMHSKRVHRCLVCDFQTTWRTSISMHLMRVHGIEGDFAKHIEVDVKDREQLKEEQKEYRKGKVEQKRFERNLLPPVDYECTFCYKKFAKRPVLAKHIKDTHTLKRYYCCRLCPGFRTLYTGSMFNHLKMKHQFTGMTEEAKQLIVEEDGGCDELPVPRIPLEVQEREADRVLASLPAIPKAKGPLTPPLPLIPVPATLATRQEDDEGTDLAQEIGLQLPKR